MGIRFSLFTTPTGLQVAVGIFIISTTTSFFAGTVWQRSVIARQNETPTPSPFVASDHPPPSSQRPTLAIPSSPTTRPSPTSTFTASASPTSTATTSSTATSTPTSVDERSVLIYEIAWAGTTASTYDEWIELYNPGPQIINLTGWRLAAEDGDPEIPLSGSIYPGGYYLLERSDDEAISDITADLIYHGGLSNAGETLLLYDPTGKIVDTANANGGDWPAGDSASRASMERRGLQPDQDDAWGTNTGYTTNGHDSADNPIPGTPKESNSLKFDTPTPTQGTTPTATRTSTATLSPTPASERAVLINEIAWAGTSASIYDEWIELYNPSATSFDLSGWQILATDGTPTITLSGIIPAFGFFLLERSEDDTISNIPADLIYSGSLSNTGETLRLLDPSGNLIDSANLAGGAWPAGDSVSPASMERAGNQADSPSTWHTHTSMIVNGYDANGNPIHGTPKQANSVDFITPTATNSTTPSATLTPSPTPTMTASPTPSPTTTNTVTSTATNTTTPSATTTPSSTPTSTASSIPSPTSTTTPSATLTLSSTPTATPTNTSTPTATPTNTPIPARAVIINEIAWAGTSASSYDEWIELYNPGPTSLDLTGWQLTALDGSPIIPLSGWIPAQGFYLLERSDDDAISDISADLIFTGSLSNTGENLHLLGPSGQIVDSANSLGGAWPAGDSMTRASMERKGNTADSPAAWVTNTGYQTNGLDANGNPIHGTPKQANSVDYPTPTHTATATYTPTSTPSATATATVTATGTDTATTTSTFTPTRTPTSTPSTTSTLIHTATPTLTATNTATATATRTPTSTPTSTATNTPSPTATRTATVTSGNQLVGQLA